ncbi:10002_t:CDS:2 [Dentiscutata erythropus]|uniref:10002_t:CDS:1 n=1 Tax=Dentiscutata erythropus TaxID=1348616 RepID=A0A9N9GW78_9GLOM|nr:10002_t:CDS:2 [Dentiscutata erythropus]
MNKNIDLMDNEDSEENANQYYKIIKNEESSFDRDFRNTPNKFDLFYAARLENGYLD